MRQYTVYVCETCGCEFTSREKEIEHEAAHLGLTVRELEAYRALKSLASIMGCAVSRNKNEKTEKKFDDAISALLKFEKEHRIKTK